LTKKQDRSIIIVPGSERLESKPDPDSEDKQKWKKGNRNPLKANPQSRVAEGAGK